MTTRARLSLCVLSTIFVATSLFAASKSDVSRLLEQPAHRHGAFVVSERDGVVTCSEASPLEALRITAAPRVPLRVFGEAEGRVRANASAGLNIILRGTAQLDANPQAKAAFERAADIWESKIANPITVYVDVDFGVLRFGEPFDTNTIASADTDDRGGVAGLYSPLRGLLLARADNSAETAAYSALPTASLPTDIGATTAAVYPSIQLRAIGGTSATAATTDPAPSIGFNSKFAYDFDPSNGIAPGTKDFEGVVVHEIGHMLGFVSSVGNVELGASTNAPSIFDWFRFRPGVTSGTFTSGQRVQSTGGTQVYFAGASSLGLSTGNGNAEGGDERQASHWQDDDITGTRIGIMDPTLGSGERFEMTNNDLVAFGIMGYNVVSGSTPITTVPTAPSNLSATGTSTSVIRLNWTDNSSNETEFRVEQKVNGSFVDIGAAPANAVQANVQGFSAGQSSTFRVRARNEAGNSGYTNEATGTTQTSGGGGCTPSSTTVCLLNNRFRVSITYFNPIAGQNGTFLAERLLPGAQNPDTALFGFSSPQAVEVVVRIQDTRPFAQRFDVYYGGMTDFPYTVSVTDTQTGTTRQYATPGGTIVGGVDRSSFPVSAFGTDDRIITSGGMDSFYDDAIPAAGTASLSSSVKEEAVSATASFAEVDPGNATASMTSPKIGTSGAGPCQEAEPNEFDFIADTLTLGVPCTGNVQASDPHGITVTFNNGVQDRIEDLFKVGLTSSAKLVANLTFTSSGDLDVFIFRINGSDITVLKFSRGVTNTERAETDTTLTPGTYYIGVSAFSGGSAYTVTASTTGGAPAGPAAPSNLTATAISSSSIRLNWTDNSNNETSFRVEQKVNGNFIELGAALANSTQAQVDSLNPGQTATFRIRARAGTVDSAYSNEATATTLGGTSGPCVANATTVCLLNNRFRVSISYFNPIAGQNGTFQAARLLPGAQNPDTGLFGFSSAQAVEVVVRVQDTRPFAPRFDVYYGGMTDFPYTVNVTDTQTGTTRQYATPGGTIVGGVDRNSFPAN